MDTASLQLQSKAKHAALEAKLKYSLSHDTPGKPTR